MAKDMRSFLQQLEEADLIQHLSKEVDPRTQLGGLAYQIAGRLEKHLTLKT
ncbi:MAG: hypothetical protein ACOX37_11110 [Bacillota bacterium]